ncbi:hypothetical protein BDN72DRAFT_690193 [Pluteus cervinus]|uniref:Uncharacterized protein n=1 Tax=Pluteus cervinus TaxID=181527 RepID=A0ACD2ZYY5_9AGAR|nr:hypothetical protein BDN72DRAFT_690193 [Pluteus cervinus]
MVDSSDRERFQESVDDLTKAWLSCEYERHSEGNLTPQPVLILANKQDKPGCIPVDEIRVRFAKAISAMPPPYRGGRLYSVFKSSLLEPIPKSGLPEAFGWLLFALNAVKKGSSSVPIANLNPAEARSKELAAAGPGDSPTQYQKLDSWLTRIYTEQSSPEEFIAQFHAINLPAWDHYTHIRIAYLLLMTYGRQRGKDMIFDGLAKYISQSPQARGRTFHFTMTYFWIQIVHFGIRSMAHLTPTSTTTATTEAIAASLNDDFARFLLMNPHVVDGNLWAEYYTKEAIMTPTAKEEMVLPDKKPLPNLVIRDALGGLS